MLLETDSLHLITVCKIFCQLYQQQSQSQILIKTCSFFPNNSFFFSLTARHNSERRFRAASRQRHPGGSVRRMATALTRAVTSCVAAASQMLPARLGGAHC